MNKEQRTKNANRQRRQNRVRAKITGTATRPRLSVLRSNAHLYLQLIDDEAGRTLVSVHTKQVKEKGTKMDVSAAAGALLAQRALEQKITVAVLDRGSYRYHGRVKAVAEAAREAGLTI